MARDLRLTVLGTGYLGVVHAACLADAGFHVLGVDISPRLVARLNAGIPAIHEPGLAAILRRGLAAGRLSFTTSYQQAADFGDVHFVCVGTPQLSDGSADLSQVRGCLGRLAPLLTRPCLVAGKSTVPAGTARSAPVVRVVDGDTIQIRLGGRKEAPGPRAHAGDPLEAGAGHRQPPAPGRVSRHPAYPRAARRRSRTAAPGPLGGRRPGGGRPRCFSCTSRAVRGRLPHE